MRKMKQPSANHYKLEDDVNEMLRSEVSRICDEQEKQELSIAEATQMNTIPEPDFAEERNDSEGKTAKTPKKEGKKKRFSVGDIIYKIFIIIMIVLCVTIVILCLKLIQQSMETDVHYIYHYNGTTGYEAPEGVTLDLPEVIDPMQDTLQEGNIASEESRMEEHRSETESETEESSEASEEESLSYDVLNGDELEEGLYFDSMEE